MEFVSEVFSGQSGQQGQPLSRLILTYTYCGKTWPLWLLLADDEPETLLRALAQLKSDHAALKAKLLKEKADAKLAEFQKTQAALLAEKPQNPPLAPAPEVALATAE